MNQNRSYNQNNTSQDNTFNFGNELDISNGRKDKTGETFFREAYDFDDFQNIGDDRTIKSSNHKTRKENFSNIIKRQEQISSKIIGNSILNQFEMSGTGFHTRKVLDESMHKTFSEIQKYPQFGDRKNSAQQTRKYAEYSNSKEASVEGGKINMRGSELSYSKSFVEAQDAPTLQNTLKNGGLRKQFQKAPQQYDDYAQSFRKKEHSYFKQQSLITKQQQYKELVSMINFYKNESQKISYERTMMQEESLQEMINLTNSQAFEEQIRNNLDQINQLNNEIQKQRAIQKKLARVILELDQEYNQIVDSVEEMDFQRPPIIKDEAKVLMDEINQLKKEFKDLQIDHGDLNLSCTLPPGGTLNSIENRMMGQSQRDYQKQMNIPSQQSELQAYLNLLLQEIHEENSISEDPQFLKNLKLACLKDEWTIFSNKEIIVSLDYKSCPLIKMRIGNKTNQELRRFSMQIQVRNVSVKYMQNEVINKKAFILEGIKVDPQNLAEVFIKINLSYQAQLYLQHREQATPELKSIRLYCPTGLMNFGEFTPLTLKQFETEMAIPLPTIQSPLKPIDKNFINSIDEIMLYIPNLKTCDSAHQKVFGLFMSVFNEGILVLIEENLDLLKIKLKNGNKPLLKLLEFILTV